MNLRRHGIGGSVGDGIGEEIQVIGGSVDHYVLIMKLITGSAFKVEDKVVPRIGRKGSATQSAVGPASSPRAPHSPQAGIFEIAFQHEWIFLPVYNLMSIEVQR